MSEFESRSRCDVFSSLPIDPWTEEEDPRRKCLATERACQRLRRQTRSSLELGNVRSTALESAAVTFCRLSTGRKPFLFRTRRVVRVSR